MGNLEQYNNSDNLKENSSLNEQNENIKEESKITEEDKKEMEKMKDNEKLKLNKIHESILDLNFSSKINGKYGNLRDIINDNIDEIEKMELLVKSVHEMGNRITLDLGSSKTETISFYCGNRALLFNYLFNNEKYSKNMKVEKSNICLPYGHCMNIAKIGGKTYIVDGGVGCFNEIEGNFDLKKNGSWNCVKLQKPIKNYKGCKILYPFTSFPYTENLSKDNLELYTSCNLQTYSYFFTNRLYEVAQEYDKNITNKEGLKRFFNEVLIKKDIPLEGILGEDDAQLKNSKASQIELIQRQLDKAGTYDENLKQFTAFENYIKTITKDYPDLMPSDEGREGILRNFNYDDIRIMDGLNIDKEDLAGIIGKLNGIIGNTSDGNVVEVYSTYILDKYENFEPILDDEKLNRVLMEFLNAIKTKAGQLNKTLREFLPDYIKEALSKK